MADNLQTQVEKLIKYGNDRLGTSETTIRGIIDNAKLGEYNIEAVINEDGTQTLNITDWDYVPAPSFEPIFGNNTPAQISAVSAEIAKQGYTSAQVAEIYGWNLGDTIPITLTSGEVIEMQIIGINHDILSSDHTSKAGITLQMKNCLATLYSMNNTSTNAGGYAASKMKTETLPMFKALLPQEWQDVIKLVDKKSANGGSTNYSETLTISNDLFLFAEIEIYSGALNAQDGTSEGTQYEYWIGKTAADKRKKYDKDADGVAETVTNWWLRSSNHRNTYGFCLVTAGFGTVSYTDANNSRGVSFGFCV